MDVDEIKRRDVKPIESLHSLIEIARRSVPDLRRNAETLVPLRTGRALTFLRQVRERVDWIRLPEFGPTDTAPNDNLAGYLLRRIGLFVALPTAVVALYLFLIASDQFVVKSQFAIRGNIEPISAESTGAFAGLIQKHNGQDNFIVRDYIHSRSMVEAVDGALGISKLFSSRDIDFWARYDDSQPIERLTRHWRHHVDAHIDSLSGIITLSVRAFTAADAVAISRDVITRSEALVNDISRRAQLDMLKHAQADSDQAEERLRAARLAMQKFRNNSGLIDPMKVAESTLMTIGLLQKDKLKTENDLRVLRGSNLDERTRGIQVLIASLAATDAQIKQLQDQLTTEGLAAGAQNNITQALLEFEGFKIEQTIAEKLVESMHFLLDKARIQASKQQVFLATIVPPELPQSSTYPVRWRAIVVTAFCCLVLWSVTSLILAGIKDSRL